VGGRAVHVEFLRSRAGDQVAKWETE
jgi:hypothetical protein